LFLYMLIRLTPEATIGSTRHRQMRRARAPEPSNPLAAYYT
jgi:hypothetical protein